MCIRPKLGIAALATSTLLLLSACSASTPRDLNYGTDVGAGYVPPQNGWTTSPDSSQEAGSAEARAIDAGSAAVETGAETGPLVELTPDANSALDFDSAVDESFDGSQAQDTSPAIEAAVSAGADT